MKVVISADSQIGISKKKRKNIDQLIKERGEAALAIIKPIAAKPNELYIQRDNPSASSHIISIRDKVKYSGDHRNNRFDTIAPKVNASYFEIWKKSFVENTNNEYYFLDRAYLHFYWRGNNVNDDPKEFFLLHCDPNDDSEPHAIYKQSLHLHIECHDAPSPHNEIWPRCHIALNAGMLDYVLESVESLTKAFEVAVLMLKNQVLEKKILH